MFACEWMGGYEYREELDGNHSSTIVHSNNTLAASNAASKYKLQVAGYSGTAGDCISSGHSLNGMAFSTHDNDNDL